MKHLLPLILSFCIVAYPKVIHGQSVAWTHNVDIPANYSRSAGSDVSSQVGRSAAESIVDGAGGSLWVIRLAPRTSGKELDRVIWLSPSGVPIFTNDFIITGTVEYGAVPIRLVRLSPAEAVVQYTLGGASDESAVNLLIRLKKVRGTVTKTETPLSSREGVGPAETVNAATDKRGFFTRQFAGGSDETEATTFVIRRYLN